MSFGRLGSKMSCILETLPRIVRMFATVIAGHTHRDNSEPSSRLLLTYCH